MQPIAMTIRMFDQAVNAFGSIDIVVNNAGVYQAMSISEITEAEFHREMNVNLLGPLLTIRQSLKHFGSDGGSIINIGSAASRSLPPEFSIYSASKSGLDAIAGVLAKELAPRGIRVNSVNPSATLSEGTKEAGLYGVGSDFEKTLVSMTPLGRIGTPQDIARVVVFLASEDSIWLPLYSEGPKFDGSGIGKCRDAIEIINVDTWLFTSEFQSDDGKWVQFLNGKHTQN